MSEPIEKPMEETGDDRRSFLRKCGTYAAVTPAAVTFLLSTSMSSKAIAASAGRPAVPPGKGRSGPPPGKGPGGRKPNRREPPGHLR